LLSKLGFMLYVGETIDTVRETNNFLLKNSDFIEWVSFSPLLVFHGTPLMAQFEELSKQFGCRLIETELWKAFRLYPCDVSEYFTFEDCVTFCKAFEKLFRSDDAYSHPGRLINFKL